MATQANQRPNRPPTVAPPRQPKILRIGVVQGGRIIEERLIRGRDNVTIGQSAKNTFVVPIDSLPRQWLLFQATPMGYVGLFSDNMDARIAVANEVVSLSQLKQGGKLKKQGNAWLMRLDERSRGKVNLGDATVLFQFVTPPPPQPRPQLPASVRGTMFSNLDWFFTTIASTSFLVHLALVIYLRSVDWPRKPDLEEIPDRFVQMIVKKQPPPEEKKEEAKKEDDSKKKKEEKKEPAQAVKKKELTEDDKKKMAEEKQRRADEQRQKLQAAVQNTGILKILGAKGDEGSLADVLGKGDVDRDQQKAFEGVGGLTVATGEGQLRGIKTGTGGSGKVASIGGLRGGADIAGASTGSVGPERRVNAVVKTEAPDVDGELDPGIIAKEVRNRMSAIKTCYERALKRNPSLSGKVVIHWTITPAGTVQGVTVESDSIGDPEVGNCMKNFVSKWRFPAPSGGAVEVSFPFVFTASQ